MTKLLNPYALCNGSIVTIDQVTKGLHKNIVCINCNDVMIARKGQKKQHHFAHYKPTQCSNETILHKMVKTSIYESMRERIGTNLYKQWSCDTCYSQHTMDVLKQIDHVVMESSFQQYRPDITLLCNGKPAIFIEVVVTHKPETTYMEYAQSCNIPIITVVVKDFSDYEAIQNGEFLKYMNIPCIRPKCMSCNARLKQRSIYITEAPCWKCDSNIPITYGYDENECFIYPHEYNNDEKTKVIQSGANIQVRFTRASGVRYLVNVCKLCNSVQGSFFLRNYVGLPKKLINRQFYCYRCENRTSSQNKACRALARSA